MDIREVSKEEKRIYIDRVNGVFDDIRNVLKTLTEDMESEDLIIQASAVWIGGNLCAWFNDFMTQIKEIEKSKQQIDGIKNEVAEASNAN